MNKKKAYLVESQEAYDKLMKEGYGMSVKIHNCRNNSTIFNTNSWVEYNEKVAVVLEKQTPKKPQEVDVDFSTFVCPSCLSTITYTDEKETHNYCLSCGQKLDWRMEDVLSDMVKMGEYSIARSLDDNFREWKLERSKAKEREDELS